MTMLRITVLTALLAISQCSLQYQDLDEESGLNVLLTKSNLIERVSWKHALGYQECEKHVDVENRLANKKKMKQRGYKIENTQMGSPADDKPRPLVDICKEYECPRYEEQNTTSCGYAARKIFAAHWITTEFDISTKESSYMAAFFRLFQYISGENEGHVIIPMTVPVITKVFLDEQYQPTSASMSFYLGQDYQDSPPAPANPLVGVEMWDDIVIYERAIGGRGMPSEDRWTAEFTKLYDALVLADITPETRLAITAGYTRPGYGQQRYEAIYIE